MLTIYYKDEYDESFHIIDEPTDGCWIHVDAATTSDMVKLAKYLNCEYTDIHDCLDKYEIPRIERIDEHVLIFTRHPSNQEVGLQTSTLTLILSSRYFVTVCPHKSTLIERFIAQQPKILTSKVSKLLIHILLRITQEFTIEIKKIRTSVLQKEKEMDEVESEDITGLTISEENLNQYLSSLVPLRNVYQSIATGRYTFLQEKDQDLLEDLLNASIQSEELCSVNLRTIRSLRDSYQIIFTNQMNKTIKVLTALTIILNIPTMVASLYGMNVVLPFGSKPFAFGLILVFIGVVSIFVFMLFQRRKWL